MSSLKIEGFALTVPSDGEKYGIENLKAVAVLAAKAAALTVSIAKDGKINLIEAVSVFRFIRKNCDAAAAVDWSQIKNEVKDLSFNEVSTLANAINAATGQTVAPPNVARLVASLSDTILALVDVIEAGRSVK
jgi:hypothetical protein